MVMPTPERLPPPPLVPPVATPTPTPVGGPMMTPAVQSIAPPAAPAPTGEMPARERTQEMPVPEEEPRPLTQWEFLGAKWTIDPTTAYNQYFEAGSADRKRWDEDYDDYITVFAGGVVDGGAASIFSPQEERMLTDLQNAISVGQLDEGQAWKQLENYWAGEGAQSRRAEEAGVRGAVEADYWKNIYRSVGPTPTLPRPEGLGFGVPPLQGTPVSQLPQPSEIFGQAQAQMGLPSQLSAISPPNIQLPNWQALGQAMPSFGGGGMNRYFQELLREGRMTAPGV